MKTKQKKTANKELRDRIKRQAENAVNHDVRANGVINNIEVKPKVSSTHVKNKIEEAFRRRGEVDADRLVVNAYDGTVELWGAVRTWSDKIEAERLSWAAPGVTKVDNHLRIIR